MIDAKTQNKLNKAVYDIALAKLPERIDKFTKWFMTGVGAALTLLITNASQVANEIPTVQFKSMLVFLTLSLSAGFVARAMCTVIIVVRDIQQPLVMEMANIFGIDPETMLSPRAPLDAKGAEAVLEINRKMTEPFLPHIRFFAMRAAKNSVADTSGRDRVSFGLVKASQWQGIVAVLSFVLAIVGAGCAIDGISRNRAHAASDSTPSISRQPIPVAQKSTNGP